VIVSKAVSGFFKLPEVLVFQNTEQIQMQRIFTKYRFLKLQH